jgi:phosphate transport system substrate-binding protein
VATRPPVSRRARRALAIPVLALLSAAALAACSSSSSSSSSTPATSAPTSTPASAAASATGLPTAPAAASASLSETGSTLLYPLFNLWVPDYKTTYPQVTITTAGTGSGTGISSAAGGTADIGASDAYLSSADTSQYPTLENIPLAISAQMINYNLPGVKGNLKLNGTILAEMYTGKITMWNDPAIKALNPGVTLPADKVIPIHRSDGSGDTFLFTTYLSKQDSSWASSVGYDTTVAWPKVSTELAFKGNSGMVTGCQDNVGCIAYIGISYKSDTTKAGLGEAQVANGGGQYEMPTTSTIAAAAASFATIPANGAISLIDSSASGAYPIINYEYAIVNTSQPNSTKAQDIKALLYWAITAGNSSKYLDQVNFQPLPQEAITASEALISKIGS